MLSDRVHSPRVLVADLASVLRLSGIVDGTVAEIQDGRAPAWVNNPTTFWYTLCRAKENFLIGGGLDATLTIPCSLCSTFTMTNS